MATLTVLKFPLPESAAEALDALLDLERQDYGLDLLDAAIVSWPQEAPAPRTRQLVNTTRAGALGGAFWGFIFGLLFFAPLLGLAVGVATGTLGGRLTDIGIDDDFISHTRARVTRGTSALFMLTADPLQERIVSELKEHRPELVSTDLSPDQEARLRDLFREP